MKKKTSSARAARILSITLCTTLAIVSFSSVASASHNDNFVLSIVKAPIVADGDVAFRQADYVINLAPYADPTGKGVALLAGDKFYIKLPRGTMLVNEEDFPVCGVGQANCQSPSGGARVCTPGNLACTTAVWLQGFPQSPVLPDVELHGRTMILTARGDTPEVVKQAHIIGKGLQNPHAGVFWVRVKHVRDDEVLARGVGRVRIRPRVAPSLNVVSVFASLVGGGPPFANIVLQSAESGPVKWPWGFLAWDRFEQPFMNLNLRRIFRPLYLIRQEHRIKGIVWIHAPRRARGYSMELDDKGMTITTPVIGVGPGQDPPLPPPLTQRYLIQFDLGDNPKPGCYRTTFYLFGGNSETLYVGVPNDEACAAD